MTPTIRKVLTLTAVLLAFSTVGMASPVSPNATFGFIPLGTVTISPGANLLTATSITLPSSELINTVPPTAFGITNDFAGLLAPGDVTALNPLTLNLTSGPVAMPNLIQFPGSDRFSFSPATEQVVFTPGAAGASAVSVFFLGTFHDTTNVFSDAPASVALSFNQPAVGGALNGSATFSTPPQAFISSVPEPGSMFLLSSALVGLVLFGRKRLAR
ncbi:MAG TPA: PEP-CTERM sorting domain-containing protein [Candidatus Acidoferrales bacterium]|jgi:hypothetical protein|nr:PEP-CTERM sorting domain-containing protein [Candidatus Acidoferrales bacterium]